MHLLDSAAHLASRSGLYLSRSRHSIWIHGGTLADFQRAVPCVRELRRRLHEHRFVFTSADAGACAWLRVRHAGHKAVAPPWDTAGAARRFFARLDPMLLICLGAGARPPIAAPIRAIGPARTIT